MSGNETTEFAALLEYVRDHRGFDFTGYKRASTERRIRKRMADVHIAEFGEYREYLESHPEEFTGLFDTVLINITGFFRDPPAWEFVRAEVLPKILAATNGDEVIRAWCPGCASGEEPYTLAMLLAEALGESEFRRRVKIYATDVDQDALNRARHAVYPPKVVEAIPPALRKKYFERLGDSYAFRIVMRNAVVFGRHDVCHDAPISHIDLVVCRNTLMYFIPSTQAHVLAQFHFALKDGGYLFLGRAEAVMAQSRMFSAVSTKYRVFHRAPQGGAREAAAPVATAVPRTPAPLPPARDNLLESVADSARDAIIAVDRGGALALANAPARELFGLKPQDLGRPFSELQISYRPVNLRSLIDQACSEGRTILISDVERSDPGGETQYFDVRVAPLRDAAGRAVGVGIFFRDVTQPHKLQIELQAAGQERETATEEIQSANEELETTNEELQSAVEELQTTNEELQSANQEMETVNEELQSTNDELVKTNQALQATGAEVQRANAFLHSILTSIRFGVVVVDGDCRVTLWNDRAEDLWGLRSKEVLGRNLADLDIGLPVHEVKERVRKFLVGETGADNGILKATNRQGKPIRCRLSYTLRLDPEGKQQGVVMLMDTEAT